jgi:DNA repair exonuclease SbcCD ATPase subunit
VLLARYHIVNERRRQQLVQQREQLNNRVSSLASSLRNAEQQVLGLQQQRDLLQHQLAEAQQAAGRAAAVVNSMQVAAQQKAQHLPVEHAPAQPLPCMGPGHKAAPPLHVGLLLLQPRVVNAQQQLQYAPQERVNGLLSSQLQQLIEQQHALGPLVCLGAAECPDVARCLAGYVKQGDLATPVATTPDGAQTLRR